MLARKKAISRSSLAFIALLSLVSCGGGNEGGNSVKPNTSGGNSGTQIIDDANSILDISTLAEDVVKDENGAPEFNEQINLKAWCVIGDPDKQTYVKLIQKFNDEFLGQIHIDVTYVGHYDFYSNLDTTWQNEREGMPDFLVMHNEKTAQYADQGMLYPIDKLLGDPTGVSIDFSQAYDNINRTAQYGGHQFAIPMDAHGFLTYFRQDIIKKNKLGFDDNTRFIPNSRAEYQTLLEKLLEKAKAGTLMVRNINKGEDHSWKPANASTFVPEFMQSTDPDGLSSLYANGGSMAVRDENGDIKVTFQNNEGYKTYVTDQVDRYNNGLMGDKCGTNTEGFGNGSCVMFNEGPWWASSQYSLAWNLPELTAVNTNLNVSAEDAADPVISKPFAAAHADGWWSLNDAPEATRRKWYGNGHAVSITRHVDSMQKVAAILSFTNWFVQGKDASTGEYNLAEWSNSGHIPAWKNVYESEEYKRYCEKNVTLKALGNPADIMAMESLRDETLIFNAVATGVSATHEALKSSEGCTKERALQIIAETAQSAQEAIDMAHIFD